jgi:hypothetical protein
MLLFPLNLEALRNKEEWLPLTSLFSQSLHLTVRLSAYMTDITLGLKFKDKHISLYLRKQQWEIQCFFLVKQVLG